ncbi:MAG: hypothetical protein ABSF98_25020 [Bryobacteraceae bacterium]
MLQTVANPAICQWLKWPPLPPGGEMSVKDEEVCGVIFDLQWGAAESAARYGEIASVIV